MLEIAALLAAATLFGGMVSFSALFAPLVFLKLPAETAGRFIRAVFPWYYLFVIVAGAGAALLAVALAPRAAALLALVAAGGLVARQILMPAINRARDAELAGDARAGSRFAVLHRGSVVLNVAQMIAVAVALVVFAR